jgi:stage II sporulation protein E
MGTGLGAAREGQSAADLLQRMLCAGFPAEEALESLNSLLILWGRSGAVTVDLAKIRLDTGEAVLYKWGAAPSWLAGSGTAEKIGTAGAPPGLGLNRGMEKTARLSLKRGETLILASDGLDGEGFPAAAAQCRKAAAGELAEYLLESVGGKSADDATVAVVRLHRTGLLT